MKEKEKYYITTAIAYSSKLPHLGNDYEIVMTDAIARYKRSCGYDVFMLTGTDEHGQKIEEEAAKAGKTPAEYVAEISGKIYNTYKRLNISFDKFIKTTDDYHAAAVTKIFTKLYENGDIYKGNYSGPYCVPCESFYTPSQIKEAGICPDCGEKLIESKEEAYYLKLSKYQERLEKYIEENPAFIQPESRKREIVNNFIKPGIQDACVSRTTIKWGVPVEFDPGHVVYVWIDALSNYITALGYNPENISGSENGGNTELFNKYWPCDAHIIGKDIARFHTIYWPIMLMGLGLPLPKQVFGHQWLLYKGEKMSKSKGDVVYTNALVDRFGVDAVRYYLLAEMPYNQDGSFTYDNFVKVFNSDLVNTLGNLLNRTVAMAEKYFDSAFAVEGDSIRAGDEFDAELIGTVRNSIRDYKTNMNEFKLADATSDIMRLLARANKYIDETKPWILGNSDKEEDRTRLKSVLYNLLECLRIGAALLSPIIPETAEKIFAQIGCADEEKKNIELLHIFGMLNKNVKVNKDAPLFMRLDPAEIAKEVEAKKESHSKQKQVQTKEEINEITIDDFMRVYLKVVKVIECTPVEKSDKLLKLQVDTGNGTKQVVSGIAKFYKPEDLIGRKVILVDNLKEVKLRGVLSQGMILAGGEEDVKVVFASDDAEIGSRVR